MEQNKGYDNGVNDLECCLHSSFADLYHDSIDKYPSAKQVLFDVFEEIKGLTTHHSEMLRQDTDPEGKDGN
jgi:hypothetical protein